MTTNYPGERWKNVTFDFEFTNDFRIEVSNLGRLRTFNIVSDGNIINGSMINGYRIVRLKLYRPRDEKTQSKFNYLQKQSLKLTRKLKSLKENNETKKEIEETAKLLESFRKNLSKKFQDDLKERTINYHSLFHRLVAEYFVKEPKTDQTIVAHLDHDKLNNRATNLKWMTPEENYEHQKSSPYVIKEKEERRYRRKANSGVIKLTVTKVMLLKKLLNQGKPMKQLVRQFKVTETQIYRIKRGENWGDIEAAK
ncbi:MAG: HNH endonuclease [Bacteroidota bacterium]|nr:HNH endonuclease [Bacteroidota bacterium]